MAQWLSVGLVTGWWRHFTTGLFKLHVLQLINDNFGTRRTRTGQIDKIMPKRDIIAQEDTFVFFRS